MPPHLSLKLLSWTFEALVEVDSNLPNPLVTSVLLTWSASSFVPHLRWIRNGLAECCESHWVALGGFCEANSPGKENKWEVQTWNQERKKNDSKTHAQLLGAFLCNLSWLRTRSGATILHLMAFLLPFLNFLHPFTHWRHFSAILKAVFCQHPTHRTLKMGPFYFGWSSVESNSPSSLLRRHTPWARNRSNPNMDDHHLGFVTVFREHPNARFSHAGSHPSLQKKSKGMFPNKKGDR